MLDLTWKAVLKDNKELHQYNEKGEETLFKEVLDNQDNLLRFWLFNRHTRDLYGVDLVNGCILHGKEKEALLDPRVDMLRDSNLKYRLIYFREVSRTFGAGLKEIGGPAIIYFLGFQYTDENDKNHKRIMKIHSDGRLVVN